MYTSVDEFRMPQLGHKASQAVPPDKGSFPLDHEGVNVTFILTGLSFWA